MVSTNLRYFQKLGHLNCGNEALKEADLPIVHLKLVMKSTVANCQTYLACYLSHFQLAKDF